MEHQDNNAHEKAIASETLKKLHEDQQRRTSPIPKKKGKGRKVIVTILVVLLIVAIWFARDFVAQHWLEILVTVATAGLILGGMYMLARLYAKKRQPKPQTQESGRKVSGKWKFAGLVLAVLLIVAGIFWTIPLIKGSTNSIQSNREKFVSDSTDLANATKAKQDTVVRLQQIEESATKQIEMLRQDSIKLAKLKEQYLDVDRTLDNRAEVVNSKVEELERLRALQQAPLIPASKRTVVLNVTMDGNKKQATVSSGGATMTVVQN